MRDFDHISALEGYRSAGALSYRRRLTVAASRATVAVPTDRIDCSSIRAASVDAGWHFEVVVVCPVLLVKPQRTKGLKYTY